MEFQMDTVETEKLPIVADEYVITARGGMTHIGFFARIAPHGSRGGEDEEKVCFSRVALTPAGVRAVIETLEKIEKVLKTGKLELVN
jgi:hypothetical protein